MSKPEDHPAWFVENVQIHEAALKSWLRSRFPWLMDVEDITQDAGIRLWRQQDKSDSVALRSPKAALFAIARNAAIDAGRHRAVVEIESVPAIGELAVLDSGPDLREIVCVREELEFFMEAVSRLPKRCRRVITLTKMYGYTEKQTAEKLGIAQCTVRTQVQRGMQRCLAYMLERGIDRNRNEA